MSQEVSQSPARFDRIFNTVKIIFFTVLFAVPLAGSVGLIRADTVNQFFTVLFFVLVAATIIVLAAMITKRLIAGSD